ncbi:MAG TPA: glucose-6-phosphate dehydrogenase [Caulobacteraceae bacterium]|nr:glucose-6-phosphate dehydrogenase [Caulobacteraceae bacterium]
MSTLESSDGIVLFGGAGDLSLRMLFPSLAFLECEQLLPPDMPVLAAGRSPMNDEAFRALVLDHLRRRAPDTVANGSAQRLLQRVHYRATDVTHAEDIVRLGACMADLGIRRPVYYLAVSPSLYSPICQGLLQAGLTADCARVVMEKPIGKDLKSSRAINDIVAEAFSEDRVFRIDHYLGKETVQNLIALRFANTLFEPLWNNLTIDHVQITVAETQGVGDRWPYYDEYGAMGDMVQNHMMQLLCLVAMEPPSDLQPDSVRNEKVKVLRSLRPITRADVQQFVVRGQYSAGVAGGRPVEGYAEEKGGPSDTETFVAIQAHIDNWRWAGVPFFLRTGKRLPDRDTEIYIQFKPVPHSIFTGESRQDLAPNNLLIRLQPEEDIVLRVMNQAPGLSLDGMRLESLPLSLSLTKAHSNRRRIAYERLLLDAMNGNSTLFVRRDEIEEAWEWVDGVNDAWRRSGNTPKPYPAGSWGPAGAFALIERTGRAWHDD